MHIILKRSLIFVGLLVAGLVIYSVWFSMKADRYDETAIPYLNEVLPKLTSWQFAELQPLLSPQAVKVFDTEQGQSVYRSFKRLGDLNSIGKPQYMAEKTDSSEGLGDINVVSYSVPLEFETGPAIIKIDLASDGETYFIHYFGIHSEIFKQNSQ